MAKPLTPAPTAAAAILPSMQDAGELFLKLFQFSLVAGNMVGTGLADLPEVSNISIKQRFHIADPGAYHFNRIVFS